MALPLTRDPPPVVEHRRADPRGMDESHGEHGYPPRLPQLGEQIDVVGVVVVGKVDDPRVRRLRVLQYPLESRPPEVGFKSLV